MTYSVLIILLLLFVSDERLPGLVRVALPVTRDMGGNGISRVQRHPLTRVVTKRTEHSGEVGNIAL